MGANREELILVEPTKLSADDKREYFSEEPKNLGLCFKPLQDPETLSAFLKSLISAPSENSDAGTSTLETSSSIETIRKIIALIQNPRDERLCLTPADLRRLQINQLFEYSRSEDQYEAIKKLLEDDRIEVNVCDKDGWSPLHIAVYNNHLRIAALLLCYGAKTRQKTKIACIPLEFAVQQGSCLMVQLLLTQDPQSVHLPGASGQSFLHDAVQASDFEMIHCLMRNKADVNIVDFLNMSPLAWAVEIESDEIVEYLLIQGANPNIQNNQGRTALHIAAQRGLETIVNLLLQNNALIDLLDSKGLSPLHLAIENQETEIAFLLIEQGADISLKNGEGKTPLNLAQKFYGNQNYDFELFQVLKFPKKSESPIDQQSVSVLIQHFGLYKNLSTSERSFNQSPILGSRSFNRSRS